MKWPYDTLIIFVKSLQVILIPCPSVTAFGEAESALVSTFVFEFSAGRVFRFVLWWATCTGTFRESIEI